MKTKPKKRIPSIAIVCLTILVLTGGYARPLAQRPATLSVIVPQTSTELRQWDNTVDQMLRTGGLVRRQVRLDTLLPDRTHERLDQYYEGVRIFGADVTRQLEGQTTVSVFGNMYLSLFLNSTPALSVDDGRRAILAAAGGDAVLTPNAPPELMILPMDQAQPKLVYRAQVWSGRDLLMTFVDANSGALVWQFSTINRQSAVVLGRGVLGENEKVSVRVTAGTFFADDQLRPPALITLDMRGNPFKTVAYLDGTYRPTASDVASDPNTTWLDGANVDAQAYQGFVYDYYFKRFGRRGLDGQDIPIHGVTHPVRRVDYPIFGSIFGDFYLNAFYAPGAGPDGKGVMVYGEGLPPIANYFAGGLDVVAHELTHAVTYFTSKLACCNEAGALNEAFSDIMGTSVEFYYEGQRTQTPNYLMGDSVLALGPGLVRSLQNPGLFRDPDHYSKRLLDQDDQGEVHSNSTIVSHSFYLAIESGTNRTSGLSVQGVGSANRDQIEKVFYRAFTLMLTSNSTFSLARAATIQAARDQYGTGSAAERAVTQAWTAVGVQ